jgi:hypothetical protein
VTDATGQPVTVLPPTAIFMGIWALIPYRLAPNEEKGVGHVTLAFDPNGPTPDDPNSTRTHCTARAGPGKYRITYPAATPIDLQIR